MNNLQDATLEAPRPSPSQITPRAEQLWKSHGCPLGRDEEIWLEAERQLLSENVGSRATPEASALSASAARSPAASGSAATKRPGEKGIKRRGPSGR